MQLITSMYEAFMRGLNRESIEIRPPIVERLLKDLEELMKE